MTFSSLNLHSSLIEAVEALGYTAPTAVQAQTIPAALAGGDWMVSSQTGSGKTAAFLLPVLDALIRNPSQAAQAAPKERFDERGGRSGYRGSRRAPTVARPQVLVLCPTRELAQQVAAEAISLIRFARGIRVATVLGGTAYMLQLQSLENASLVVATPGRLLDLHRNHQINLDDVHSLVVDEADRMLDLGFSEDLEAIHQATEDRERTMMFSATFAPRIMSLASAVMRSPKKIELVSAHDSHQNIEQRLHWADDNAHKAKLLEHYLNAPDMVQTVVFASTQIETDALSDQLRAAGYRASALHGGLPQPMRNRRIKSLREGHIQILVATDVAARGIDVPAISHVINYGLPMKSEDYVHRIGRTGRAGRSGVAITLATPREKFKIRGIETFTQQRLNASPVPGLEPQAQPFGKPQGGGRFDRDNRSNSRYDRAPRFGQDSGGAPAGGFVGPVDTPARAEFAKRAAEQPPEEFSNQRPGRFDRERGDRNDRGDRGDSRGRRGASRFEPRSFDRASTSAPRPSTRPHGERTFERSSADRDTRPPRREHDSGDRFVSAPRPAYAPRSNERFDNATSAPQATQSYAPAKAHKSPKPEMKRAAAPAADAPARKPGPALTPAHPDGNRSARRAKLAEIWSAAQAHTAVV